MNVELPRARLQPCGSLHCAVIRCGFRLVLQILHSQKSPRYHHGFAEVFITAAPRLAVETAVKLSALQGLLLHTLRLFPHGISSQICFSPCSNAVPAHTLLIDLGSPTFHASSYSESPQIRIPWSPAASRTTRV